ncbi:MAG: hypothetical protein ACLUS5_02465 [Roseburia faecis]
MLKKLLQNQQNLKADGIYSCTGIYFFKSACTIYILAPDHKRDTKREPRYGKISDTGNLKMKNMQKMMKMFAGDRMAWKI